VRAAAPPLDHRGDNQAGAGVVTATGQDLPGPLVRNRPGWWVWHRTQKNVHGATPIPIHPGTQVSRTRAVTPEAGGRLPAEQGSQGSRPGTDPGDTRGGYAAPVPGGAACPARTAAEPVPLPFPNHTDGPTSLSPCRMRSAKMYDPRGGSPSRRRPGSEAGSAAGRCLRPGARATARPGPPASPPCHDRGHLTAPVVTSATQPRHPRAGAVTSGRHDGTLSPGRLDVPPCRRQSPARGRPPGVMRQQVRMRLANRWRLPATPMVLRCGSGSGVPPGESAGSGARVT
jgi:hypothetical protein